MQAPQGIPIPSPSWSPPAAPAQATQRRSPELGSREAQGLRREWGSREPGSGEGTVRP